MSKETEIAAVGVGGSIIALFLRWLFGKRKARVDLLQAEIKAMGAIIETWKQHAADESKKAELLEDRLNKKIGVLEKRLIALEQENKELKDIINAKR